MKPPRWWVPLTAIIVAWAGPFVAQCHGQAWRTALTVSADVLVYEDVVQSIWAQDHGAAETNPLLGRHPQAVAFIAAGLTSVAVNTVIARRARPWFNVATILVEGTIVLRHTRLLPVEGTTTRIGIRLWP